MRVSSNSYSQVLDSLSNTQDRIQNDLLQLSTSRRVNAPSDDPSAAAQEVGNLAATADAAQYEQNISSLQSMMQTATSALSSVVTSLNQVISDGVSAGGGTMSTDQQQLMATTVSGIRDQIINFANSSVQGVFLFGGTASTKAPFQLNSDPTTGVTYSGNSNTNSVPIGSNQTIQSNVPGNQIFASSNGNVMQSLTDMVNALQSGSTSGIQAAVTEVRNALNTVSLQQSQYSSISNQLDSANTYLQSETVTLQDQENNLVGANLTQVVTSLTQDQTTEQATLQATAKVLPMSLLNYLQ